MPSIKVITLSKDNKIPENLKLARNQGVIGMVHKATSGTDSVDEKAEARIYLAKEAGMLIGLSHCITKDGSANEQVKHFVDTATALGLEDNWLLAVEYDDEKVDVGKVTDFLEALEAKTKRAPVVFGGPVLKDKLQKIDRRLIRFRLWLLQHEAMADFPLGWKSYFLWQYTDDGTVPGVTPPTACSDYVGSDEQLASEWSEFKGKTDTSLPEAAPIEQGEPESGTAPVEQQPAAPEITEGGELDNAPAEGTDPDAGGANEEESEAPPGATTQPADPNKPTQF